MKFSTFLAAIIVLLSGCSLLNGQDSTKEDTTIIVQKCSSLADQDRSDIPGKVVFSGEDETGISQIYTMNADGSNLKQLTHFGPDGGGTNPVWSPDGSRIAFANYNNATTLGPYLYVIDADGSHMRPLKQIPYESPTALIGSAPAWSPDGTSIAYQVCTNCERGGGNYEILVVEVAGEQYDSTQVHAVTDHPASDTHPTWSPDGTRIAFASNRDYVNADSKRWRKDLYVKDIKKKNLTRLTKTGNATHPVWSPNGSKIAYEWNIHGNEIFIYEMDNGKTPKIETGLQFAGNPLWSDEGSQLLIFGKETEQSTYEMRLISFTNDSCKITQTVPLDMEPNTKYYDWYMKK